MRQLEWHKITKYQDAPTTCGVYQYWKNKELLYIGKAVNLRSRLASHAQNAKLDPKERAIIEGRVIKYALCDTEFKALILESELIRTHKPSYNRAWKDDKSYLYIVIDLGDSFPRPHFARAHDLTINHKPLTRNLRIFGPFPSSHIAEELLRAIRRLIPFCMSKNIGKRACFYSRIGLCNPCPSGDYKDRNVVKKQYRKQIRQVIKILEGQTEPVIKSLMLEMKKASAKEDYETALAIRTKLERFERFISFHNFTDRHFSYNDADSKLASLQTSLSPYYKDRPCNLGRIECYDASNSGLQDSTVSTVVMNQGLLDKGEYRRFKIKNPRARSDFHRLNEALTRRLKNKSWPKPDLIVIDGGVPQLRSLQRIFDQFPDPPNYLGIAKRPERLVIPTSDGFATLKLSKNDPGLQLLIQLRDEAHRFANNYRKLLAKKRIGL